MSEYIHGSTTRERERLLRMNRLINAGCLDALKLDAEKLVLDVGAGTGEFTTCIAAALQAPARIIAVENDPAQLASAIAGSDGHAIEYREGDAAALPITPQERGAFDLAHTRFLLEHCRNPQAVVREMVAAVRPGGRIVLADDDHDLLRMWPEPSGALAAWRAYFEAYRHLGNDPLIGRKLVSLLHQAGARPVRNTQVFYGACQGDPAFAGIIENLIAVMLGAADTVVAAGAIDADTYRRAVDAIGAFAALPDAALWYGINWAEGRR